MDKLRADIAIVGAGNAALTAALAAAEAGAKVVVLEAAPEAERGGNSAYTAGAMRTVYDGVADLKKLIPDLSDADIKNTDFGGYSFDDYFDDMARVTQHRADADLLEILIRQSLPTLEWMRGQGVRFQPSYGRQAFKTGDRFRFWGGLAVEVWGGGPGLVQALFDGAARAGVRLVYEARARELILDSGRVEGVRATLSGGETLDVKAGAVVLASGGFEANGEMRARYLGPGWDLAKVRGTRHNMGDGIRMALEAGAEPFGNWSGCHAVGWDMNAPPYGDLAVGDGFQKHSYPFGIMVNALGARFLDEGADFRNYTTPNMAVRFSPSRASSPGRFSTPR
jgi:tricarballylate dehydrogenase